MSIQIKNLKKSFDKRVIFEDFNYTFSDTGIYLLKADSGVGKTTLLRIIAGLDKSYSGEIIGISPADISFAFQEYRLFPTLNLIDNVMIASESESTEDLERAENLLARLGLGIECYSLLPSELSGGMRQRVSLARALLKKSQCLLLDEPTKELDASLIESFLKIIEEESKSRFIIISTHDSACEKLPIEDIISL